MPVFSRRLSVLLRLALTSERSMREETTLLFTWRLRSMFSSCSSGLLKSVSGGHAGRVGIFTASLTTYWAIIGTAC